MSSPEPCRAVFALAYSSDVTVFIRKDRPDYRGECEKVQCENLGLIADYGAPREKAAPDQRSSAPHLLVLARRRAQLLLLFVPALCLQKVSQGAHVSGL